MMSSETFKMDSKSLGGKTRRSDSSFSTSSISSSSSSSRSRSDESEEPSPKKIMLKSGSYSPVEPKINGVHNKNDNPIHHSTSSHGDDDDDDDDDRSHGSSSPNVPEGQYEVEHVVDYTKEGDVELYLVKWKGWEEEFNTWEPPRNLVNCDAALLSFYRERKNQYKLHASRSKSEVTQGGRIVIKGQKVPFQVPPNPLPFQEQVKEFFEMHGDLTDQEKEAGRKKFSKKKPDNRTQAATAGNNKKLTKLLQDGMEGKLAEGALISLRKQLVDFEYLRLRQIHRKVLQDWQDSINAVSQGKPTIVIENEVDWAGPPEDFIYTNDYVTSPDVSIPDDPPVGCDCSPSCFENKNGCCASEFGTKFAYNQNGRLRVPVGTPIYECNKKCACDEKCPNRVVQDGQKSMVDKRFCIFRTSNGCGWGVKTLTSIKKGSFVTLYVGEVINTEEAERRGRSYDAEGCTYLFDLDFNEQEHCPYTVDAAKFGNIAHFINHSCDPNLAVFAVWVNCLDVNLPKLALFAIYDIPKGEEITFDYKNLVEDRLDKLNTTATDSDDTPKPPKNHKPCLCGTKGCRQYLF